MKAKELIKELQKLDPETDVFIADTPDLYFKTCIGVFDAFFKKDPEFDGDGYRFSDAEKGEGIEKGAYIETSYNL